MRTCTRTGSIGPIAPTGAAFSPNPGTCRYAPLAVRAQQALSLDGLRGVLTAADIEGKQEVLESLAANFASYVMNVDAPPETALLQSAASHEAQPQTFLMAPSISVRVVVIESSTPVNTGG